MSNTCEVCGKEITGTNASRRKACAGECSVERTRRYWHAKNAERWKDPAYRARSLARNNYHFHNTPKYRDRHRERTLKNMRKWRAKKRAQRLAEAAPNNPTSAGNASGTVCSE